MVLPNSPGLKTLQWKWYDPYYDETYYSCSDIQILENITISNCERVVKYLPYFSYCSAVLPHVEWLLCCHAIAPMDTCRMCNVNPQVKVSNSLRLSFSLLCLFLFCNEQNHLFYFPICYREEHLQGQSDTGHSVWFLNHSIMWAACPPCRQFWHQVNQSSKFIDEIPDDCVLPPRFGRVQLKGNKHKAHLGRGFLHPGQLEILQ